MNKTLYISLILATCFYYTIEPTYNLMLNYQQLKVMYKVDSLNSRLQYSESRIKSLEAKYDSLFCETLRVQEELQNEREEKLKLLENDSLVYKPLFYAIVIVFILTYLLIYKYLCKIN